MVRVSSVSDTEVLLGSSEAGQGIWLNVIEKAYGELVLARCGWKEPAIDALSGTGTSTRTLQLFTGHEGYLLRFRPRGSPHMPGTAKVATLAPQARAVLIEAQRDHRLTCSGTTTAATPPGIVSNHCYAVLGYDPATDLVHLWNPWGTTLPPPVPPAWSPATRSRTGSSPYRSTTSSGSSRH